MHGKNSVASVAAPDHYNITEIFHTIQGEGPFVGMPAVFVRFAGCNLRCFWCDTDFGHKKQHTLTSLVEAISAQPNAKLIVLTGGEPMLHNLAPLIAHPLFADRLFQIETAGTVNPYGMSFDLMHATNLHLVCSPKTIGINLQLVSLIKAWKYIIRAGEVDDRDGLPNRSTQAPKPSYLGLKQRIFRPFDLPVAVRPASATQIYVQPCDEGFDIEKTQQNLKAAVTVAMKYNYRLSLQTHKILGLR